MLIPSVPAPLAPFDAYATDVARLGDHAPLGAVDDAWLVLAHTLARSARSRRAEQASLLAAGARGVRSVIPYVDDAAGESRAARLVRSVLAAAEALDGMATALHAGTESCARDAVLGAVQDVAADAEQLGAFHLARAMLSAVRTLLAPALTAHTEGLLLSQEGRVARQLSELDAARALYQRAARLARGAQAPDVAARALLGLGVLASMRGDYPESRRTYRRAISAARRAGSVELRRAAHHGLLFAAYNAKDVDSALAHGWAAVQYAAPEAPDERAEGLVNVAAVGYLVGADRAALGACLSALELTTDTRIALAAFGTAVRAAARLGERRLVTHLTRELERTMARSGRPFESAHALIELAEGLVGVDDVRARQYAAQAELLGRERQYHEITLRAERAAMLAEERPPRVVDAAAAAVAPVVVAPPRTARARSVLRAMEALTPAGRYALLTPC